MLVQSGFQPCIIAFIRPDYWNDLLKKMQKILAMIDLSVVLMILTVLLIMDISFL